MAAFAQFGSDLDKATQAQLSKGERLVEILKQDQYQPLPVEKQIAIIFAATKGFLDDIPVSECGEFERELYKFLDSHHPGTLAAIREKKQLDDDLSQELSQAIANFKEDFKAKRETAA